ncbi:ABC transporter related [Alkaliphilus metalliredigens QYMF]|uniref:ABC transporter related n=1 Tax=Alkaliphilus metalliredigens (strain QYMF) TaxID=293826 RepID=A6TMF1_ALKMQ|nr:ATP-binding cassette domain-containing protein [Alkaliphilus metalliredigens]ABR47369.1 ABC transporter related [Alkaliphilus metalliredigens QYMF]
MSILLEIKNLVKDFNIYQLHKEIRALKNVDLKLEEGKFIGITGRSGSGKSTILKCIYGTYLPQQGEIFYDSNKFGKINLAKASKREIIYLRQYEIGYVSQFLKSMPRVKASELVEEALIEMGSEKSYAKEEAMKILSHFEIDKALWDSYPNTFSGGEKLRLNIARAMVKKPRLLLLDEPTASLDQGSKEKVKELIIQLKAQGTTMLGIFHDLDFMKGVCDQELQMKDGMLSTMKG